MVILIYFWYDNINILIYYLLIKIYYLYNITNIYTTKFIFYIVIYYNKNLHILFYKEIYLIYFENLDFNESLCYLYL